MLKICLTQLKVTLITHNSTRAKTRGSGRRDRRDYADDYARGSRGSRSRDRRDFADYEDDYEGEMVLDGCDLRLSRDDIVEWKRNIVNADGTRGPHFKFQSIIDTAEKLDCDFRDFTEETLCMTTNFLYSVFCETMKRTVMPEKELIHYVEMAKAFLEAQFSKKGDEPYGDERLAILYNTLICDE